MARKGDVTPPEVRAKISAARMGQPGPVGYRHTAEARARMSAAQRGHVTSDETRAKLSGIRKGKSIQGHAVSEEQKENIRAALRIRVVKVETRVKRSIALRGRVFSEESRRKMSLARRARIAPKWKPDRKAHRVIGICAYCGAPATEIDHVVPRCRGGSNHPSNKVPCCRSCNASKHDLLVDEWLRLRASKAGFLIGTSVPAPAKP